VSASPGAEDDITPSSAAAAATAAFNQAMAPTLSQLTPLDNGHAQGEEDQTETLGERGLPSASSSKKPSQSRFAATANIFAKVKQRAKSLARPEPLHLESAPTTPVERTPGGTTLPPLPAFLFDPQAEGTSSHAQVLAYGYGTSPTSPTATSPYGRSKSDVLPSVFRSMSTASGTSSGANPAGGAGSSSGRPSREYSYTDPRAVGSARLQEALERDVPANASTTANGGTRPGSVAYGARASLAELQWSQMLYDS
jgi:hypothetical protein